MKVYSRNKGYVNWKDMNLAEFGDTPVKRSFLKFDWLLGD